MKNGSLYTLLTPCIFNLPNRHDNSKKALQIFFVRLAFRKRGRLGNLRREPELRRISIAPHALALPALSVIRRVHLGTAPGALRLSHACPQREIL